MTISQNPKSSPPTPAAGWAAYGTYGASSTTNPHPGFDSSAGQRRCRLAKERRCLHAGKTDEVCVIEDVGGLKEELRAVAFLVRLLASIKQQTQAAVARGETLEQARKSVNPDEFHKLSLAFKKKTFSTKPHEEARRKRRDNQG